jgi:hypothetical protein
VRPRTRIDRVFFSSCRESKHKCRSSPRSRNIENNDLIDIRDFIFDVRVIGIGNSGAFRTSKIIKFSAVRNNRGVNSVRAEFYVSNSHLNDVLGLLG